MPRSIAAILVSFTAAAFFQVLGQDVVRLKNGGVLKGRVVALTSDRISLVDESKKSVSFKESEVASFTLDDPPPGLRQAELDASARQFERAVSGYQEALKEVAAGKSRQLHNQFIYLKLARAHRAAGDLNTALETLRTLRKVCGDCRLRLDAFRESIDIAREQKDRLSLEKVLEEMKAEPEPTSRLAELERAKIKLDDSDPAGAQEILERLGADLERPHAAEARLWSLRALRSLKRMEDLEKACRAILESRAGVTSSLRQAAGSTLGEILLERVKEDPATLREALLASAQAVSAGPPAGEEPAEDYVRALMAAGRACQLLAAGAAQPGPKQHYLNRAQGYYGEVTRSYRQSDWAKRAAEEMARLEEELRASKG